MEQSPKILIIDDEESIRYTFGFFLSEQGYLTETARDYEEALEKISETDFDLIFIDVILGGKTGIDIMREIRSRKTNAAIVIITGDPNVESASGAIRLGAFDYISKPVRQETLLHTTKTALKHKFLVDEKERYRLNLEGIFESVRDAIITLDDELKIMEVNRAASEICGISSSARGMPLESLESDCGRACLELLIETAKTGRPAAVHHSECSRRDRPGRVVSLSATPLITPQNSSKGAVLVIKDETRVAVLERDLKERRQYHNLIGRSRGMQEVFSLLETLAEIQTTVLITGESGTGKELVAEALHYKGPRRNRPLVKVNCSALSENLLESELFGHVKGAFTGAVTDKQGRFQRADGGTLFLDEIGDVSPRIQLRLLRVLQETEFERVGDSTPLRVDVRIIAATNQDLSEKVKRGEFREDLFYRLKVVEVLLPPLRDRAEDIPLLTDHFIQKFNRKFNKQIRVISADVEEIFMHGQWAGNVRELEHAIEHAFILCRSDIIAAEHLPMGYRGPRGGNSPTPIKEQNQLEIREALEKSGGNKAKAARLLGIDRKTLYRKLWKYKIDI